MGGYWFQPLDHGLRRALAHILRARIIGKALAEIDRIGLPRDARTFPRRSSSACPRKWQFMRGWTMASFLHSNAKSVISNASCLCQAKILVGRKYLFGSQYLPGDASPTPMQDPAAHKTRRSHRHAAADIRAPAPVMKPERASSR